MLPTATVFQNLQTGPIVTELLFIRDHIMYTAMKFDGLFLNNLVYIISQAPPLNNLHVQFLHKNVQLMKLPRVFH